MDAGSAGRGHQAGALGGSYRKLLLSSSLTNLADGIGLVAWSWLASLITRDPLAIALVGVAQRLPWFVLALPAGVIVDRLDRRVIVVAMDALRFVVLWLLALCLAWPGIMPAQPLAEFPTVFIYWLVLASALTVGSAEVLRDNSAITLMPALVPPARLETANARLFGVELVTNMMVGPPLAGLLLALALPLSFGLTGAAFALAGLMVFSIRGRFQSQRTAPASFLQEAKEGLSYLFARPLLRDLAIGLGFYNAIENMLLIALVLYAQEVLGLSSVGYGLLLAGGAVGGLAAAAFGERIIGRLGRSACLRIAVATLVILSATPLVLPFVVPIWLAFAVFSMMAMVWNIITISLRQRLIPVHLLGRVNSVYRLFGIGMIPLGFVVSGVSVTAAEPLVGRHLALFAPFLVGTVLAMFLLAALWRRLSPEAIAAFAPPENEVR